MELSVESLIARTIPETGHPSGQSLDEWNEAYRRVEAYFSSFRIRNKLLLNSLVFKILDRANKRSLSVPNRSIIELAAEESDRYLVEWFRKVLDEPKAEKAEDRLSARGRLALSQVENEIPWQQYFLSDEVLPDALAEKMRTAYLHADPDFSFVEMRARPIDLGIVHSASKTLEEISQRRVVMTALFWIACATALTLIFFATR